MDGYYDITIKIGYPDRLVPKYAGGEYTAQCDVGEDNLLFLIERTNDREFLEYCELLEEKGYSLHSENSLSGNIFKTYVSSEQMLHLIYRNFDSKVRIISAPMEKTVLIPNAPKTVINDPRRCEITQMIINYYSPDNSIIRQKGQDGNFGACYIVTLDDGSLLVYDGGGCYNKEDEERLFGLLCEKGVRDVDGKIVISAWIITHEHQDHYWCMYKTLLNHGDEIRIKQLYVTSMPLSFLKDGSFHGLDGVVQTDRLAEIYANTARFEIVRMHTGQKFNIRNVQIEVLYTLEDIFPEHTSEYCEFNDTSTVTRMSVDGGTFMNLGDAYKIASCVLCDMYGNDLKSDICTVAHHGWGGCTVEVYDNIMPEIFTFPFSKKWFDRMINMTTRTNSKGEEVLWIQWAINRYGDFYKATHRTFDIVDRDLNRYLLADGCNKTIDLVTREVRNETVYNEQINYPY